MFPSKFLQFPSILTHFHAANEKIQNGGRDLAISRGLVWVSLLGIWLFNTLRPRQNGRRIPDDIFKCIFLTENIWISLKISLKFVPKYRINNIPALVQIMAWRRPGDKPLSEPMLVSLPTHLCVARPQWVNLNLNLNLKKSLFDWIQFCTLYNSSQQDYKVVRRPLLRCMCTACIRSTK